MVYSALTDITLPSGKGTVDSTILVAMQTLACSEINARILAAGLTPPASNDTLKAAESILVNAYIRNRDRNLGDNKNAGNPDTYDSTNKYMAEMRGYCWLKVDEYIKANRTELTEATDVQDRADLVGTQFQLDQNRLGGFV